VTRAEFRLHPLARVVGLALRVRGRGIRDALRAFRDADAQAGNEISIQAQIAAFGANNFTRLQTLKSRYDPDNVLHRNQNIPPRNSPPYQGKDPPYV
jgi:hypothetical protein